MRFIDLKRQYEAYQKEIETAVLKVLRHINYILGPEVEELEKKLAAFVGVKEAIGVSSGTDALYIALKAFGIKPGDTVITTPFTFIATAEVIRRLGAHVLFVDVDEDTMNISPDLVEKTIKKSKQNIKAIIPVSLFGLPADLVTLENICKQYGLILIEDACQSFGASIGNRRSGSFGNAGAVSFFPAKPLGCCGDGGMIFTNDQKAAQKMRAIRIHGQTKKYWHEYEGLNGRLDTLQAAILLTKFKYFEEELNKRQEVANRYRDLLKDLPEVKFQKIPKGYLSSYAQFTIRVPKRDHLAEYLKAKGIPTAIYYPVPLHLQPVFSYLGYKQGSFPVAEKLAKEVISLPMHPFLKPEEQEEIVNTIKKFYGG